MPSKYLTSIETMISGIVEYLLQAQETSGKYTSAFWSELAYHVPYFDYHAGGSHHNRTVGSAGLAFMKLSSQMKELNLSQHAEKAFDWVITQQHNDGGLFEITNNDKPSQFHLEYERSAISPVSYTHLRAHET